MKHLWGNYCGVFALLRKALENILQKGWLAKHTDVFAHIFDYLGLKASLRLARQLPRPLFSLSSSLGASLERIARLLCLDSGNSVSLLYCKYFLLSKAWMPLFITCKGVRETELMLNITLYACGKTYSVFWAGEALWAPRLTSDKRRTLRSTVFSWVRKCAQLKPCLVVHCLRLPPNSLHSKSGFYSFEDYAKLCWACPGR